MYDSPVMKYSRYLFHLTGVLIFAYDLWYHANYLPIPPGMEQMRHFGGMFKYLTVWDLFIQLFYHLFSVICDIRPNQNPQRSDIKWRDYLFAALAFPLAMFVSTTFWAIFLLDEDMILPAAFRKIYPQWLNHLDHTVPAVLMLFEAVVFPHSATSRKSGLSFLISFAATYLVWVLFLVWYAGVWVYPFLKMMSWPFRAGFIASSLALFVFLFILGELLIKRKNSTPVKGSPPRSAFFEEPISPGNLKKTS